MQEKFNDVVNSFVDQWGFGDGVLNESFREALVVLVETVSDPKFGVPPDDQFNWFAKTGLRVIDLDN